MAIDPGGTARSWARSVCPNGQVVLLSGEHLVCDSDLGTVSRFSAEGAFIRHELQGRCAHLPLRTPNDLVVDAAGGVYVTDSVRHTGHVFYRAPDGRQRVVATGLDYPNGLALSADERCLYVAESYQNRVLQIGLAGPGATVGSPAVFARLPVHASGRAVDNLPDGMAFDATGRLWVAHYGMGAVQVLSPTGAWLFAVETGLPLTSNVLISDAKTNERVLIVTGGFGEPGPGAVLKLTVTETLHYP